MIYSKSREYDRRIRIVLMERIKERLQSEEDASEMLGILQTLSDRIEKYDYKEDDEIIANVERREKEFRLSTST